MKIKIISIRQDDYKMRQYGGEWWHAEVAYNKSGSTLFVTDFKSKPTVSEVVRVFWASHFGRPC